MTATGQLAKQIKNDEGRFIKDAFSWNGVKNNMKRYKNFPLFDIWSSLLNAASTMLPTLMLGFFFNPSVVGFYALSYQVLSVPMSIIGSSIAQVFFPYANEAKRSGQIDQLTIKIFRNLLAIGFVPILLLTVVAPDLFALVFGGRWYTAGEYTRWLSVWLLFVFISSPLSNIYSIMEKQREGLIVNIVMFGSRLLVLVLGGIKGEAHFTVALFGITGVVLWIFNCIYIQQLAGVSVYTTFVTILKEVLRGTPYALVPMLTYFLTHSSRAFALSGLGTGLIFLTVFIFRRKIDLFCVIHR